MEAKGDRGLHYISIFPKGTYQDKVFFALPVVYWKMANPKTEIEELKQVSDSIHKLDENSNPVIVSLKPREFK